MLLPSIIRGLELLASLFHCQSSLLSPVPYPVRINQWEKQPACCLLTACTFGKVSLSIFLLTLEISADNIFNYHRPSNEMESKLGSRGMNGTLRCTAISDTASRIGPGGCHV